MNRATQRAERGEARRGAPSRPGPGRRRKSRVARLVAWLLPLMTLAGGALRLLWLGRRQLHYDEALQWNGIQTRSWSELISHCTHTDMHPPLSYLAEKLFGLLSPAVACLRLPSVIVGTAAIPATYWALRPLTGRLTALAAAAVTLVSYHMVWYSRELRGYIFFHLFAVLSFGCFVRVLRAPEARQARRWLAAFAAATVLSAYSHYNTYLLWPLFGALLLASECVARGWRGIRWRLVGAFAVTGVGIVLLVAPTFIWFRTMYHVQQDVAYRPALGDLARRLALFGFGLGWRGWVWGAWMAAGALLLSLDRRRRQAALAIALWMLVPLAGYLYLFGMPRKFVDQSVRYQIVLTFGFSALGGAAVAALAWRLWPRRARLARLLTAVLLPVALAGLFLGGDFVRYYRLRSTGYLCRELAASLASRPATGLLLDNYYVTQYLQSYLPPGLPLATPPIFNTSEEYAALDVAGFTRRCAERFPLLALYDSTDGRGYSAPGTDWSWVGKHFRHDLPLLDEIAVALRPRGLNFFTLSSDQVPRLYWNALEDLPAWYAARGVSQAATLGVGWFVIACAGEQGMHQPLPVTASGGDLFLYNGASSNRTLRLRLSLAACAPGQRLRVVREGRLLAVAGPFGQPMNIIDLRTQSRQSGYVPLATLARQHRGLLPLPLRIRFTPATFEAPLPDCPPGLSTLRLVPESPEGVVLLDAAVLATDSP